ncbi:MAG: NAD(+)/NADH kinase [Candidatus Bilamarchaeaceae archaeon]
MKKMKLKVITNPKKEWAVKAEGELKRLLVSKGFGIVENGAEATICFGGDGTILYNHFKGKLEGPVLGIGTETSRICLLNDGNWKKRIASVLMKGKKHRLFTLEVKHKGRRYHAVNDVVVHTKDYRVIWIFVKTGRKEESFEGDGIIVSTPVGSTAYAYSAGGSIISPDRELIEVAPICPYMRKFQTTIIGSESRVELRTDRKADLVIDGILVSQLEPGEVVRVVKGPGVWFYK